MSPRGDFHRVRVKLVVAKPLVRFVTLAPEGQEKIVMQVKYEKLPRFCAHCGHMGLTHLECGAGEYEEADLQFGVWMVAKEESWKPGTPRFRNGASREAEYMQNREGPNQGGRGEGGTSQGGRWHAGRRPQRSLVWQEKALAPGPRKRSSTKARVTGDDEDLRDTTSSPNKPSQQVVANQTTSARKQLEWEITS